MTENYEQRLASILRFLADREGAGRTAAYVAQSLRYERSETVAKLRSLAHAGIVSTSSGWERPARYWLDAPHRRMLRLLDGAPVAAESRESRGPDGA